MQRSSLHTSNMQFSPVLEYTQPHTAVLSWPMSCSPITTGSLQASPPGVQLKSSVLLLVLLGEPTCCRRHQHQQQRQQQQSAWCRGRQCQCKQTQAPRGTCLRRCGKQVCRQSNGLQRRLGIGPQQVVAEAPLLRALYPSTAATHLDGPAGFLTAVSSVPATNCCV